MSTSFYAEIAPIDSALQFGDAGRIEIWSKPTTEDITAAMSLLAMKRQVIRLCFKLHDGSTVCEFLASIAPFNSALRFSKTRAKIRLDVPETELTEAAKLIGYTEHVMRLEVESTDKKAGKTKPERQPKVEKPKGMYGKMWEHLWLPRTGFLSHPDMLQVFSSVREIEEKPDDYPLDKLIKDSIGVDSRTQISPTMLRDWLCVQNLSQHSNVWMIVQHVERQYGERKAA